MEERRSRSLKRAKVQLKGEAREAYGILKEADDRSSQQLLRAIERNIDLLKQNPFYGNNIQKRLIPKVYGVKNLWRVELINYWRMLYTIKGNDIEIICFILDIIDHKNYDKRFGYRKK